MEYQFVVASNPNDSRPNRARTVIRVDGGRYRLRKGDKSNTITHSTDKPCVSVEIVRHYHRYPFGLVAPFVFVLMLITSYIYTEHKWFVKHTWRGTITTQGGRDIRTFLVQFNYPNNTKLPTMIQARFDPVVVSGYSNSNSDVASSCYTYNASSAVDAGARIDTTLSKYSDKKVSVILAMLIPLAIIIVLGVLL